MTTRIFASLLVLLAASIAAPARYRQAGAAGLPSGLQAVCAPAVTLLAHGFGEPDDVAVDGKRVLFTDIRAGVLAEDTGGRVRVLARGLDVPEGIVVRPHHRVLLVEQGRNQIDRIDRENGRRQVVLRLANSTGKEGVDAIAPAPGNGIYLPDSPYGRLYLRDANGHLHLLASGMGRPVDAIAYRQGVAVADEYDGIWLLHGHQLSRVAAVSIPDDLTVIHGRLLAVTLGDGGLWEVYPRVYRILSGFGQPQGLAMLNANSLVIADSTRNGLYRISGLAHCV